VLKLTIALAAVEVVILTKHSESKGFQHAANFRPNIDIKSIAVATCKLQSWPDRILVSWSLG